MVYYIGFYLADTDKLKRKNIRASYAGSAKMEFVLQCLRALKYDVTVVSICPSKESGFVPEETFVIDEHEKHVYLSSLVYRIFGKNIVRGDRSLHYLKKYIRAHVTAEDIVMNYHSLVFGQHLARLKKQIGFRWIVELEELYRLATSKHKNSKRLAQEEAMFADADGYLFVNELHPMKYSNGKPYAVSYGSYAVCKEEDCVCEPENRQVVLTYTGIVNEDRGLFIVLDSMQYLPDRYTLRILGMGEEADLARMRDVIAQINHKAGFSRVEFMGTRTGEQYSAFLADCQIGLSLMDVSEDFSCNAFPSKIMAYLGHGLKVVTTRNECIEKSCVKDILTFCDRTPESMANAILGIDLRQPTHCSDRLREMERDFLKDLKHVLEGERV